MSTSAPSIEDARLHRTWQGLGPGLHEVLLLDDDDLAATPYDGRLATLQYSPALVERLPERGYRLTDRGRRVAEWGAALANGIVREPTPRDLWDLLDDEDREALAEGDASTNLLEQLDLVRYPAVAGERRIIYVLDGVERREAVAVLVSRSVSGEVPEHARAALLAALGW